MKKAKMAIAMAIFLGITLNYVYAQEAVQKVVGLQHWDKAKAYNGYTLFAPLSSKTTYLIDMAGKVVNKWESDYQPGQSAYLLEDGHLLRTASSGRRNNTFHGGGAGGRVQEFSWDGKLVWDFEYSSSEHLLHHDMEKLLNGNVLMIAWERKNAEEAIAAGRDPQTVGSEGLWADHVIEVKPTGKTTGQIVWEWHVWDHLVQDYDPEKANYGVVAEHPELININVGNWSEQMPASEWQKLQSIGYVGANAPRRNNPDWNHTNSISYNAELDQIALSVLGFSEIWVIDHSTTTKEASGHTGGKSGKGGDLLYRWGNPQVYNTGTASDQQLFSQHDASWIPSGMRGAGNLLAFNNGRGRPGGDYSSVDEIAPPVDKQGRYTGKAGTAFGPTKVVWTYTAPNKSDFYSSHISGAQRLANGNTLICSGESGTLFEVTPENEIVWRYISPAIGGPGGPGGPGPGGPKPGGPPPGMNRPRRNRPGPGGPPPGMGGPGGPRPGGHGPQGDVFKVCRYASDYPGLAGKNLTPGKTVEELLAAK